MEDMGIDRVVLVPDSPDRVDLRQFNVERSGNQSNLSVYGSSLRGNRNNDRRHWHDQRNPMDVDGHEPQDRSGTFLSFEHTHPSQDRPFVRKAPMINNFNRESGPSTERQHVDKGNRSIEQDDLNSIFDMAFPRGASRNYAEERKGQTSPSNRGCLSHSNPISSRRSSSSYKGKGKIDCSGSNGSGLAINARNVIDLSCGSPDENIELVPMAHVPANLPRVPGQRRLVRNGCISPINIASQFRTSSEGEHVGSSFVEKGQGEDMISDGQLQADIEEIVEESNDGRKGKGKEVLTNPPTLHKRTADAKYASTSNPVSSENMANQVNGACVQPPGNWRTTRSHARKNVQPLADPAAASFVGEQHEKRASLRDNANGTFANCPCASNYVTTRSKSRNSSGLNRTSEPYPKRQKTHGPTLEINHGTLPANDDVEVLFLGSGQELSSSRPSSLHSNQYERVSRGLNTSYQVDSTSSGIRLSGLQVTDHVDNDDSYARARQVEEDEKPACEIQEQLYFGADESNTDTTSALQQEEYSYEHLFDDAMISTSTLQQEEYSYELLLDDAMISRANEIDEDAALGLEEFGLQNHSRSFNVNSSTLRPSRQGRSQSSSSRRANQAQAPTTRASQLRTRPSSRQRRRFVRAPITRTSRLRTGMFNQPSASTSRVSHRFYPANILMHLEMGIDMFEELEAAVDNEMSAHFTLSNFLDDPLDFHDDFPTQLTFNEDNHRHNEDNHQHGVSIDRINSLPESVIQIENSEEICAICLESPATGETIRHLPCLHKFHKDCIDPWLTRKTTCPMCKSSIT